MSEAFYVGKNVILQWLHDFLELEIKKVEECNTGAIYVQLMDALYPGKVPLYKVNFDAKTEYDYIRNFKVLQDVFTTEGISKPIDVSQLIKGKAMDNLEFLQWLKHFFDNHYSGQEYHAADRRKESMKKYREKMGVKAPRQSMAIEGERKKPATTPTARMSVSSPPFSSVSTAPVVTKPKPVKVVVSAPAKPAPLERKAQPLQAASSRARKPVVSSSSIAKPQPRPTVDALKQLKEQLVESNTQIEHLEKERNFFYDKLREVELLCQDKPEEMKEFKQKILDVLYRVDENSEFVSPDVPESSSTAPDLAASAPVVSTNGHPQLDELSETF